MTGLAKAAATGAVFDQDLDDVLIATGLLRNRNIGASSSATAFREAVRRGAGLGPVHRPDALHGGHHDRPGPGHRGLLAFNAVMNASSTTMRARTQVTVKDAEAVEALRSEMASAEGTAARFRDKLLDTFEEQKALLHGTLQTFAVVLGEVFTRVSSPLCAPWWTRSTRSCGPSSPCRRQPRT